MTAHLPEWSRVETAFRGVFARKYFANNGPLVRELDQKLAADLGVAHAICVTNGTVALTLLASAVTSALEIRGEVIVPALAPPSALQALQWAGLTPVLCDVDHGTLALTPDLVAARISARTVAIAAVHRWGFVGDPAALEAFGRERNLPVLFDGRDAAGGSFNAYGAGMACSLQEHSVFGAGEGGFVLTDDQLVADRLRTMRNFRPSETFAPVTLRTNGKMSEAQAALGLLSLADLPDILAANRRRADSYRECLRGLSGVRTVVPPSGSNHHALLIAIGGGRRDAVRASLTNAGIPCRVPAAVAPEFPVSSEYSGSLLQLPNLAETAAVCAVIRAALGAGRRA